MPSQSAIAILDVRPHPSSVPGEERVQARLRLTCGCVVERTIAADRILTASDGATIAVGKYPCPEDHPVQAPTSAAD